MSVLSKSKNLYDGLGHYQDFLKNILKDIKPSCFFACLTLMGTISLPQIGYANPMMLGIELSPAVCRLQPNHMKMRQCIEGNSFTVNYFHTGEQAKCNSQQTVSIPPLQEKVVAKIVPDPAIRQQLWQNYGICSGMSQANYFRSITNLSSNLRLPRELTDGSSYRITSHKLSQQIASLNTGLKPQYIHLMCQNNRKNQAMLTQINICYDNAGRFTQCQTQASTCPTQLHIQGFYQ